MSLNQNNLETPQTEIPDKEPFMVAFKSTRFWTMCIMAFSYACKKIII
jgi:hypothetical protein